MKIVVDHDGPVIVTPAELEAAGWPRSVLTEGALSLEAGGERRSWEALGHRTVDTARPDGWLFYGQAMTGEYTRENVYWLRPANNAEPFPVRDVRPGGLAALAGPFEGTWRWEEDSEYYLTMEPEEGDDRWMWGPPVAAPGRREVTVSLPDLATEEGPATLHVMLHGYTEDPQVDPDHHARLLLNGRRVADVGFDGVGPRLLEAGIPQGLLRSGVNTLSVELVGDTGASLDDVFLNWIELSAPTRYAAHHGRLDFRAPRAGRLRFELTGFESPDVMVLDVTDPNRPARLDGIVLQPMPGGGFSATFEDVARPDGRYVAFERNAAAAPVRIEPDGPSSLRSTDNGADYIIVTGRDYLEAVAPLARRRADEGLRATVVPVDDIYDEFSAGVFDPHAIRAFLAYAYAHWRPPAPMYVLLVGEANLDYRGGYGPGPRNDVPSMQTVRQRGGAATSDLWFAAVHGEDPLPDILLGRLPASTAGEATTMVDKILGYPRGWSTGGLGMAGASGAVQGEAGFRRGLGGSGEPGWQRHAVLVADDDEPEFQAAVDDLARQMPEDMQPERFYAAQYPLGRDLTGDIVDAIDAGALLVDFAGHGNVDLWSPWPGGGYIFDNRAIARLKNADRLPLLTAVTCMNGWFNHPLKPESLAEAWLRHPGGGGIAAISMAGLAPLQPQQGVIEMVYRGIFSEDALPLGALLIDGIARAYGQRPDAWDTLQMLVLLGDPALIVADSPVQSLATPTGPPPRPTRRATTPPTKTALPGGTGRSGRRLYLPRAGGGILAREE